MDRDPRANRCDLPIAGFAVLDLRCSNVTLIEVGEQEAPTTPQPSSALLFNGAVRYRAALWRDHDRSGQGAWEPNAVLMARRGATIAAAWDTREGAITIRFDDGARRWAEPDDHFEGWEVSGSERLILASPPGGGDPRITT